jgi:tetratricopeptide (TPR) repeat protein
MAQEKKKAGQPLKWVVFLLSAALFACIAPCASCMTNEDVGDYILFANNNILRGQFDEAIKILDELISKCDIKKDKTDCSLAYYLRGKSYEHKGDIDQALSDFSSAIKIDPRYMLAYYTRAVEYQKRQELNAAIADYTKIIELDPKQAHAYNNRAMIYDDIGSLDLAILDFNKAIEFEPELINAHFNRGLTFLKRGDYYQAVDDFTKEAKIHPNSAAVEAYRLLAAYFLKEEYDVCWEQVDKLESMHYTISPAFLAELKKASGREK